MDGKSDARIENANYDKVHYFVEKVLSETERFCPCRQCRLDAAALALNTLPPHYFVKSGGPSRAEELGSPWILIEMAVRESLERVALFPHHKPEELNYPESSEEDSMSLET
ncbi:MAG: late competence development ComFB family protein [Nitrospirota bacterium]